MQYSEGGLLMLGFEDDVRSIQDAIERAMKNYDENWEPLLQ